MQSLTPKISSGKAILRSANGALLLLIVIAIYPFRASNTIDEGTSISIEYYGVMDKPIPSLRIFLDPKSVLCINLGIEHSWHFISADRTSFDVAWEFLRERQNRIDKLVDPSFKVVLTKDNQLSSRFNLTACTTSREFSELVRRLKVAGEERAHPIITVVESLHARIR